MRDNILFAVLGLGAGALVASIALGVVLVYRGSGIINVAMGAIAMVAAYIFWALRTDYFGFTLSTDAGLPFPATRIAGDSIAAAVEHSRPDRFARC